MRKQHVVLGVVGALSGSMVVGASANVQTEAPSPQPDPAVWSSGGEAEPSPEVSVAPEDAFRLEFNTWIWVTSIDGTLGKDNVSADVDASFSDILDASDSIMAFSGRLELGYGRIGAYIDAVYQDLGFDDMSGPRGRARVDVELRQTIIDFGLMYRLGEWEPSGEAAKNPRKITLDAYAGGRYTDVELRFDPRDLPSRTGSKDWLDPIVGAKLVAPIAERWHLAVNGDIGGFGVESDLTWSATGVIGYNFTLFDVPSTVSAGYRAIGWDYSDDGLTFDIVQHGLILGFGMRF